MTCIRTPERGETRDTHTHSATILKGTMIPIGWKALGPRTAGLMAT